MVTYRYVFCGSNRSFGAFSAANAPLATRPSAKAKPGIRIRRAVIRLMVGSNLEEMSLDVAKKTAHRHRRQPSGRHGGLSHTDRERSRVSQFSRKSTRNAPAHQLEATQKA